MSKRFGDDFRMAFDSYDADHDGAISTAELLSLLGDAGVGNGITRSTWATGIIDYLDRNRDGIIQWAEFETVFKATA